MSTATERRPELSVAMIVKNEAAMLPGFLERTMPLADEICVVDTGSTDETMAIARDAGCRVDEFPWSDDFAAARNASLSLCQGTWILVLDADERIDAADYDLLRRLTQPEARRDTCYRFITRNYTNASNLNDFVPCLPDDVHARGYAGWFPSGKVRLFPNIARARFEGCVHELVNASLERSGLTVADCDVLIHHYPLDKPEASISEKRALYIRLARQRAAEQPTDAHARALLAEQCVEFGDYAEAIAAYHQALRLDPTNAAWLGEMGGLLLLLGRQDEAQRALTLSLKLDDTRASTWRNLGVLHAQADDWPTAGDYFQRAVEADPGNSESLRYLAMAHQAGGRLEDALAAAERALAANPGNAEAAKLLSKLREQDNG